jgi:IPT/TIG domain
MTRERRLAIAVCVFGLYAWAALGANAQQSLLRITSPATGDVVMEGQPLKIVVAADDSVRMVYVVGWTPLPSARPIGNNVFEMDIPKTVPPGKYQLTAMGVTTAPVYSTPVEIQVEREDLPVALKVPSMERGTKAGVPFPLIYADFSFPIFVQAEFADGSKLDVTHSMKTTFESKDPAIVTVDEQSRLVGHGPGETTIVVGYAGQVYTTILVAGPRPKPKGPAPEIDGVTPETGVPGVTAITVRGRHFGESQGAGYVCIGTQNGIVKSWSDNEIVATVPERTHQGTIYVEQGGLNSNVIKFVPIGLFIDAISGRPTPGNQIHIQGSGFESEQGSGYVTIADIKAQVVQWSSTKIIVTVPDFSPTAWTFQLAVHQNGKSAEFRLISPQKSVVK